jgi:hypothetical protein
MGRPVAVGAGTALKFDTGACLLCRICSGIDAPSGGRAQFFFGGEYFCDRTPAGTLFALLIQHRTEIKASGDFEKS